MISRLTRRRRRQRFGGFTGYQKVRNLIAAYCRISRKALWFLGKSGRFGYNYL